MGLSLSISIWVSSTTTTWIGAAAWLLYRLAFLKPVKIVGWPSSAWSIFRGRSSFGWGACSPSSVMFLFFVYFEVTRVNSSTLSASPLLAVILRSAVSKYAAFFFNLSFPFSSSFLRWGQAIYQAAYRPLYSGHFFVVLPSGWFLVLYRPEHWPYTTSSLY